MDPGPFQDAVAALVARGCDAPLVAARRALITSLVAYPGLWETAKPLIAATPGDELVRAIGGLVGYARLGDMCEEAAMQLSASGALRAAVELLPSETASALRALVRALSPSFFV